MAIRTLNEQIALLLKSPEELTRARESGRLMVWLPLLEHPADDVMAALPGIAERLGWEAMDEAEARRFAQTLAGYALSEALGYWATLAVAWLEDGLPMTDALAEALDWLGERGIGDQKTRHAAFRLARRHERARKTDGARREKPVRIELTGDEALVLFEMLSRCKDDDPPTFEHEAEKRVLWDIEAVLETRLLSPFSEDYWELLAAARERVANDSPHQG